MISAPTNWNTLWANPSALLDILITVRLNDNISVAFDNSDLVSCDMQGALFSDVSIGNACSCSLAIVIKEGEADYQTFAQGQEINLSCRLRLGSTTTSYVSQGTYYIDTAELRENGDIRIVAYDSIVRTAEYVSQAFGNSNTSTFSAYLDRLSTMYDGMFDYSELTAQATVSGTIGNIQIYAQKDDYAAFIPFRDVLATVAGQAGGNIALDKSGKAHLYRFDNGPTVTTTPLGEVFTAATLKRSQNKMFNSIRADYESYSKHVTFNGAGYNIPIYRTGKVIDIQNNFNGASTVVNNMYYGLSVKQLASAKIQTSGAYINPIVELGDIVSLDIGGGEYLNYILSEYKLSLVGGCWGEINVPMSENCVKLNYNSTWNSSNGWISGFTSGTTQRELIYVTFESVNRLTFVIRSIYSSYGVPQVLGRISDLSATSFPIATTYLDSSGQSHSMNITGYISNYLYAPEMLSQGKSKITVDVIADGIPAEAVGQTQSATFDGKSYVANNTSYSNNFQIKTSFKPLSNT